MFPSATDLRSDELIDVYYGAADHVIAAARVHLPLALPASRAARPAGLRLHAQTEPPTKRYVRYRATVKAVIKPSKELHEPQR